MGRGGAVEIPRRRLDRSLGGAAGRRRRDAGVRESALRARRARPPPWRSRGRRGRVAAHTGRPGPGRTPARSGRRERACRLVYRRRVQGVGGPPHRCRIRRAREHPGLGGDRRRVGRDVRRDAVIPSSNGFSTASTRRRRRAGTVAASSLPHSWSSARGRGTPGSPTSSSTFASTTTTARSRSFGDSSASIRSSSVELPGNAGSRSTTLCATRSQTGSQFSATSGSRTGPASRTSRSASTARTRSIRSCSSGSEPGRPRG